MKAGNRRTRWLAWGLGLLLLLVVAVPLTLWLVLSSDAVSDRVRAEVQQRASERLGREVTVGEVEADLFPSISVVLRDFKVAGAGDEPPFVEAAAARVDVKLWPLLRSFGNDVQMDAFTLETPTLNLVKTGEETWSYEPLAENLEKTSTEGGGEADFSIERAAIENGTVRLIDRTAKPEAIVTLQGIALEAEDIAFGEPLEVEGSASIGGERQNVEATLALDRLPRSWERKEDWPRITAEVEGEDLPLEAFRDLLPAKLGAMVGGGAIDFRAGVKTLERGEWDVTGRVDVGALQLRTGEGSAGFTFATRITPGDVDGMKVALNRLHVKGPGVELGGTATVSTEPMTLRFALAGPHLNLDTVMDAMPEEPAPQLEEGTGGSPEPLVSAPLRAKLTEADVAGTLKLDVVQSGKLAATNLEAEATLKGGVLALEKGSAALYGGRVDLAGTTIALAEATPKWDLKAALSSLQLGTAMNALTGQEPIAGELGGTLRLTGEGNEWQEIREAVTGVGKLTLTDGALAANLREALSGAVVQALEKVGRGSLAKRAQQTAKSGIERLDSTFRIDDGWLVLAAPLALETPIGEFSLGGRVGLSQALDLEGSVALPPAFVSQATGGQWKPAGEVLLPIAVGGTVSKPVVTPSEPKALLEQFVGGEAKRRGEALKEGAEEKLKDEVKKRTEDLFDRF